MTQRNDSLSKRPGRPVQASREAAIGGYFELETRSGEASFLAGARRYQSGRAALQALLRHMQPSRVWLPRYICPVVVPCLRTLGIAHSFYSIDRRMRVSSDVDLRPNDLAISVDYFGIADSAVDDAISRFGADHVVVDASQSLFRRRRNELAVFYSPRKFVGIPDGGLLDTDIAIPVPDQVNEGSLTRMDHLLMRADGRVEEGYAKFREAEESLRDLPPMRMSTLTSRLLDSIHLAEVAQRRRTNYALLAERLTGLGERVFPLAESAVPLCFAVVGVDADDIQKRLMERSIYTPRYWPDIPDHDRLNEWERLLCDRTIFLPCDQRYRSLDMERLANAFFNAVAASRAVQKRSSKARPGISAGQA